MCNSCKLKVLLSLLLYYRVMVSITVLYPPERLDNMLMALPTPIQHNCDPAGEIYYVFAVW
jgi:hypothetical protein